MTDVSTSRNAENRSAHSEPVPFSRRVLKLEHPENVGPLLHIACWLTLLAIGLCASAATDWYMAIPLIILLSLSNFSLTIGVLHMHTHRPLFVSRPMNRMVDIFCSWPSALTAAEMREVHILSHHRYNDGPGDITSTEGRERGLGALWYWTSYGSIIKKYTIRTLFAANPSEHRRRRRHEFTFDMALYLVLACAIWYFADGLRFFLFYVIPFISIQFNSGYFAWMTHAPARSFDDDPSKSLNNAGNILNFFIFNQGYHSVHHRYPGIHWSQIPDKLDFMRQVQPEVIVPYWMTINSAWRVAAPGAFLTKKYGERWKAKLDRRLADGTVRSRYLRWFAWI